MKEPSSTVCTMCSTPSWAVYLGHAEFMRFMQSTLTVRNYPSSPTNSTVVMQNSYPLCTVAHNANCTTFRVLPISFTARTELQYPASTVLYFSKHRRILRYIQHKIRDAVQAANFRTRDSRKRSRKRLLSSILASSLETSHKSRFKLKNTSMPTVYVCSSCYTRVLHSNVNRSLLGGIDLSKSSRNYAFPAL